MVDVEDLLAEEVFVGLSHTAFQKKYVEEVGELEEIHATESVCIDHPEIGNLEIYVLENGYCAVHHTKTNKWSLFETAAHAKTRKTVNNWADFSRGFWSNKTPTQEGIYFARSREGFRQIREIRKVNGRLIDISGGLVPPGEVTTWKADWWYPALPGLPDSI